MALQAPAHVHLDNRFYNLHASDITVTSFAIETRTQVGQVAEVDKIGLRVDAHPGDGFSAIPVAGNLLYRWAFSGDHTMAAHALLHRWNASHRGAQRARMTIQTLYAGLDVSAVAVGNGLLRCGQDSSAGEENPCNKPKYDQQRDCDENKRAGHYLKAIQQ